MENRLRFYNDILKEVYNDEGVLTNTSSDQVIQFH